MPEVLEILIEPYDARHDLEIIFYLDSDGHKTSQSGLIPKLPSPGRVYTSGYNLRVLHKASFKNKKLISQSIQCGCFYCKNIFAKEEIREWVDGDLTAMCPRCGIDSVIGDNGGVITEKFLEDMNQHWFKHEPPTDKN